MEMTGLGPFFQAIAAEKDVVRGKPAPDVFLAAAEKIGVDPWRCVVFEDAHVGIEAGRAAGAKTVAVATTHPAASFDGTADLVVETLEEVSLATLHGLFAYP
jgi:beta-phosphoglucomutase-like phosphatase (HAD superfamily)